MNNERSVLSILRYSSALCFIGHGVFGLLRKPAWLPYLYLFHIPHSVTIWLMPCIGALDIMVGLMAIFRPSKGVFVWMVFWALFTALLRVLVGEGIWEFWERAGNYGAPAAFLVFYYSNEFARQRCIAVLRASTCSLLVGHGALMAIQQKTVFASQVMAMHLPLPKLFLVEMGYFEIAIGFLALFADLPLFFILLVCWKVGLESSYPLSGSPIWEFVERWGSYGVPLALSYLMKESSCRKKIIPLHV